MPNEQLELCSCVCVAVSLKFSGVQVNQGAGGDECRCADCGKYSRETRKV